MDYLHITTELIIGFFALFLVTKILGKTQFAQITPFDFISALILGEMVGNAIFDENVSVWEILFAVAVWGILIYIIELLSQKFKGLRGLLEGQPTIVIDKGKINYQALKTNKLDINQLQTLIREKGYFSITEVEYALLETDGSVSVLPKHPNSPLTKQDLDIKYKPVSLPITLILDGELVKNNLTEAGFDEDWLKKQLEAEKIHDYKEVLYSEWHEIRGLHIQRS
ncbi:DUF421 domain-containing protein [Bacillus gobiensis]|uniref:DUF421 domain-containing protein n=1 Tax=Bacillus gobiensis TaxID=1441095 RepID=UPI003D1F1F0C